MDNTKISIRLCLGSSCFSRGNEEVLEVIKTFIEQKKLQEYIDFRGHLCQGLCNKGPNLSIGEKEYQNVSMANIHLILEDALQQVIL